MQERTELLRMINQERKMLDAVVEQGLDHEGVYEQSKKLDALIEKYYGRIESLPSGNTGWRRFC